MIINPKDYKPAIRGKSDKYSWNLYKVLNEYKGFDIRVHMVGWSFASGFCPPEKGTMTMYFGSDGLVASCDVIRATCVGDKSIGCVASYNGLPWWQVESVDITEKFFSDYLENGVCSIHGEHSHNWISINKNSRKCKYCGKHERRKVVTKRKIQRVDFWS